MCGMRQALALAGLALLVGTAHAEPEVVPGSRAVEYVGREVAIEGRVVAVHVSPLATVLAFAPNFAGFTATILAADRSRFPEDIADRARNQSVRVTGLISAYRGKPEMRISEPSQLAVLSSPVPANTPAGAPTPAPATTIDAQAALARLEARVRALELRLSALEGRPPDEQPAASIGAGSTADDVRAALGAPARVTRAPGRQSVWSYDDGRSVTLDGTGHVVGWSGF